MNRRTLTTWLSALLLLMAGLTSATHGAPAPELEPEPCHEMAQTADMGYEGHHGGHSDHSDHTSEADCLTDCQCCPGSCSGVSALTASQWQPSLVASGAFANYAPSHPHSTPLELLRPPIEA